MKATTIWIFALAFAGLVSLSACSIDSTLTPEQQVKQVLEAMEQAIEARNNSDLFEHVSDDYYDHKGNDKKALRRFAQVYMLRNQRIEFVPTVTSIETVDDNTVALEAKVLMGAKRDNGGNLLAQLSADAQDISAVFQREDGDWRLISMSWANLEAY